MTVFETDSRTARTAGILATAGAVILGFIFFIAAVNVTIFILMLPLMLLALAGLGAGAWLLVRTYQLATLSYAVDRNALVIRAGPIRQIVPLRDVTQMLFGHELTEGMRFQRVPLTGWWIGRGSHPKYGRVEFYASQPIESQIMLITRAGAYALSPFNEDAFIETLNAQLAIRPSQRVQAAKIAPSLSRLGAGLLEDRVAWALLICGLAINFILFGISAGRYPSAPSQLVLHFNAAGIPDRFGSSWQLVLPALFGFGLFIINFIVGLFSYREGEELASYLIWGGNIAIQLMFAVAMITIGFASGLGT